MCDPDSSRLLRGIELSGVEPERDAGVSEVSVGLDASDVSRERVLARLQDVELRRNPTLVAILREGGGELAGHDLGAGRAGRVDVGADLLPVAEHRILGSLSRAILVGARGRGGCVLGAALR